ncbi:hypothetical protein [Zavarzinia aquatilis]|uniref:Uncharacterized protein n=1 Tax=Zavarzinia aquatilis TaxID=2211142 RepID=A0A317EFG1_9PROT|nr:hypothetical protein [Zavarzinia aquatilis]PWR24880.1 hypothetical protein DKG74_03660 [Zavarzinia aquatilis]
MDKSLWLYLHAADWPPLVPAAFAVGLGGLFSLWLGQRPWRLGRSAFVLVLLPIFGGLIAANALFWLVPDAYLGGWLTPLMAGWAIGLVILGLALGLAARARSREAFGRTWPAFAAFVPLAGIALVLLPGPGERTSRWPQWLLTAIGILGGVGYAGLAVLWFYSGFMARQDFIARNQTEQALQLANVSLQIDERGLHAVTDEIARSFRGPVPVDPYTELVEVTAEGRTVRYDYAYELPQGAFLNPDAMTVQMHHATCLDPLLRLFMEKGATIERRFHAKRDFHSVTIVTTLEDCSSNL